MRRLRFQRVFVLRVLAEFQAAAFYLFSLRQKEARKKAKKDAERAAKEKK